MSVKTIRFNKNEEKMLVSLLTYYSKDFSSCIKELMAEKLEDIADMRSVRKICESRQEDYFTGKEIDSLCKKKK